MAGFLLFTLMFKRGDIVRRTQSPKKFGTLSPEALAVDYVILGQETHGVVIWYRATTVRDLTRVGTDARDEWGKPCTERTDSTIFLTEELVGTGRRYEFPAARG